VVTLGFTASNTFIASSFLGNEKRHFEFHNENGKCLLEFHILFSLGLLVTAWLLFGIVSSRSWMDCFCGASLLSSVPGVALRTNSEYL
jgi:hypothetical protein